MLESDITTLSLLLKAKDGFHFPVNTTNVRRPFSIKDLHIAGFSDKILDLDVNQISEIYLLIYSMAG